jgi:hypothetical protein
VDEAHTRPTGGAAWKIPLLMVVFLATFVPYLIVAILATPLDLASFAIVWVIFFVSRANLRENASLFVSLVCGVLLAFPASAFVFIHNGSVYFRPYEGNAVYGLLYYVLLMWAAHNLAVCIKWARP